MSATSSIMSSSDPDSSPTSTICNATGVNTPEWMAVRNTLSPRSTPSRIFSMRSAM